jgi:hypothetical protein
MTISPEVPTMSVPAAPGAAVPARRRFGLAAALALVLLAAPPLPAAAADAAAAAAEDTTAALYRAPADVLTALVDAPPTPTAEEGPRGEWLVLEERPSLPPIAELAARELRLAGMRIDPVLNGPSRTYPLSGLTLVRSADGETRAVTGLPAGPRLDNVSWSPDGSHLAFTHNAAERIEPWVVEVATGRARRLADVALNLAAGAPPRWLPDGWCPPAAAPSLRRRRCRAVR